VARIEELGRLLRAERRKRGLSIRAAADEVGVSFNVLARVERGHLPDIDNYQRIVRWMGIAPSEFEPSETPIRPESTPEVIAHHLWLDPYLSESARQQIASVVRDMYSALARPQGVALVHLKAARTFKPAAANLLSDMLDEMRAALSKQVAK